MTQWTAVANATRWPRWTAVKLSPIARWVLPVPGGPSRTILRAWSRNTPAARSAMMSRPRQSWWSKLKSLRLRRLGTRRARSASRHPETCRVLLVTPPAGASLVGEPGGVVPDPGCWERVREVADVLGPGRSPCGLPLHRDAARGVLVSQVTDQVVAAGPVARLQVGGSHPAGDLDLGGVGDDPPGPSTARGGPAPGWP